MTSLTFLNIFLSSGCVYDKPCTCQAVTSYITGAEPTLALTHFNGIVPGDLMTAMNYLGEWTDKIVDDLCKSKPIMIRMYRNGVTHI